MSSAHSHSKLPPFLPWALDTDIDNYMGLLKQENQEEYREIKRMTYLFVRAMLERGAARKHAHQSGGSVVCGSKLYNRAEHAEIMQMQGDYKDCVNDMMMVYDFTFGSSSFMLQVDGFQPSQSSLSPTEFYVDVYKPMHILKSTSPANEKFLDSMAVEYLSRVGMDTISEIDAARADKAGVLYVQRDAEVKPPKDVIQPRLLSQPNRFLIWGKSLVQLSAEELQKLREDEAKEMEDENKAAREWDRQATLTGSYPGSSEYEDSSDEEIGMNDPLDYEYGRGLATNGRLQTFAGLTEAYKKGRDPLRGEGNLYHKSLAQRAPELFE